MKNAFRMSLVALLLAATSTAPAFSSGGHSMPAWMDNAVIYEVNVRQYSPESSFSAVTAALPRLKSLGVNVLWLMPIYPISEVGRLGTWGSYYAVKDYTSVNQEFGTTQDFATLVSAAHAQGFKVILDWVANHTGWDHPWISQHPDWYVHESSDPNSPIISPNGWNDVADLNYDNSQLRTTMIDAMKYWVNTFDIDGFRCDFASGVPVDFWSTASSELNATKPLFMLAESEGENGQLNGPFDAEYGWTFKDKFNSLASLGIGVAGLDYLVTERLQNNPIDTAAMLFITNHDENSWNGTEYQRLVKDVRVMTVLYFTLPGIPLVYTGQEISMDHALAFFDKDPIDWSKGKDNVVLRKMIALKRESASLAVGSNRGGYQRINLGNSSVFAFVRYSNSDKTLVIANVSNIEQKVSAKLGEFAGNYREVMTNVLTSLPSTYVVTIPANGYRVFSSKTQGGKFAAVKSVTLSKTSVTLKVGKSAQIKASVVPSFVSKPTLTWTSANRKVATVSATGLITAKRRGSTTIVLRTSNKKVNATVRVTVK